MSGDDLVKAIIEHYGVWGIVLLMGVLIVITVFIKTITNFEWIKTLLVKPHLDSDKLSDHIFFKSAKSKLKYVIPTLDIVPDKPITQQVFIDLIYLTVESFYYGCKNIINTQKQ